jgi:acyl carrier protein
VTTTFDRLAELVRETLSLPGTVDVRPEQLLFYDLEFTSLDLLDLLFRIEERLGISVVEGTIYRLAKGDLDDAAFAHKAVLTPLGRERFMALLADTPRELFPERIEVASLPRYVTVGALARLLDHLSGTSPGAPA